MQNIQRKKTATAVSIDRIRSIMLGFLKRPKSYKSVLQILLTVAILLSVFFVATETAHALHGCEEEDCPICAALEVTQENIRGALPGLGAATVIFCLTVALTVCAVIRMFFTADTPVALKVRLDR